MLKLRMEDYKSDSKGASRAKVDKEAGEGMGVEGRVGFGQGRLLSAFHPASLRRQESVWSEGNLVFWGNYG